jgi:23S rRNA pseudouridine1911/1915/1917 synthase
MGLFPKDRDLSASPEHVEIDVRASDFRLKADAFSMRLDAFLQHHLSWRSRSSIQGLIRDGFVQVDASTPERGTSGSPRPEHRVGRKLRHGSRVVVRIPEELRLPEVEHDPETLGILYEDEEVIAVDKPPLMPVHPSGRHLTNTVIQLLHARYRHELEREAVRRGEAPAPPWPEPGYRRLPIRLCHRLDRETSGLLLVAKGDTPHRKLMRQFERRQVQKEYLAIVHGIPDRDGGRVEAPIGPARASAVRLKMACVPDGQPSATEWRVVERLPGFALVACRPHTGRQHQIRLHMDYIGHPLVGDKLYGVDEDVFLRSANDELTEEDRAHLRLTRHALHNHALEYTSPANGESRRLECPLASDLARFLDALRDAT